MEDFPNPQAFACPASEVEDQSQSDKVFYNSQAGMSLRDYFAGQAISSMVGSELFASVKEVDEMSYLAYGIADAMLKTRLTDIVRRNKAKFDAEQV